MKKIVPILSLSACLFSFAAEAAHSTIATASISRLDQAWWRSRFNEKQRELSSRRIDLVWLGDSITQNWEKSGPEDWQDFKPIWQRFYGDRNAINLGFKGDSTCHVLWRIDHGELSGIHPKLVILLIGANNFGHIHTDADETFSGIRLVVDRIHQKLPDSRVLMLGVLPSIRSKWVDDNTRRLNSLLPTLVDSSRPYLLFRDIGSIFLRDGKVDATRFLDPRLTPPDPPLHPTAQSQQQIAAAIEPIVTKVMADHMH
jgi:lysophospholipase L1-like esterase